VRFRNFYKKKNARSDTVWYKIIITMPTVG